MEGNNIKKRMDILVKIRQDALDEIEKIQKECDHSKTNIGIFSWRVGNYQEYYICKYCQFPVKPTGNYPFPQSFYTTLNKIEHGKQPI